jgi:hypothetical protein
MYAGPVLWWMAELSDSTMIENSGLEAGEAELLLSNNRTASETAFVALFLHRINPK